MYVFRVEIDEEKKTVSIFRGREKTERYEREPNKIYTYHGNDEFPTIDFDGAYDEYEREIIEEEFYQELKNNRFAENHPIENKDKFEMYCYQLEMQLKIMQDLIPIYKELYHVGQIERARRANIEMTKLLIKLKPIIKEKKKQLKQMMIENGDGLKLPSHMKPKWLRRKRKKKR